MCSPRVQPTFGSHSHTVAGALLKEAAFAAQQDCCRLGSRPASSEKVYAWMAPLPSRQPAEEGLPGKAVLAPAQLRVPSQISPRSSYTAAGRLSSTDCSGPKGPGAECGLSTRL